MSWDCGEHRMLVQCVRVEDTHEEAMASVRDGHDELWKFLGPYGWSKGYMGPDGKPAKPGLIPTLEESIGQKVWAVGRPLRMWPKPSAGTTTRSDLRTCCLFPAMPGDPYEKVEEQLHRIAEEVLPLLPG